MADDFGYHIDHHGSLVRPPELLTARAGGDPQALARAEDDAVVAAAHMQRRLTLSAVGDGQFRREHFESVVYDHVEGFAPAEGSQLLSQIAGIPSVRRRTAPARPERVERLAQAEAALVLATTMRPVFVGLPSPGYLAAVGSPLLDSAALDSVRARGAALAEILRQEIADLAAEGVVYVALGNPLYTPLLTVAGREQLQAAGVDPSAVLACLMEADRAVLDGLAASSDFRIGLDLAESGPLPTTERGYDLSALDTLLDVFPFHRLCVDYPADPTARLPLERIKPGLVVSLGVVDVSTPEPEVVDDLLERTDPVVDLRGTDDVAIATNGGFAVSADSPTMTSGEQKTKLELVETVARYYWGNEI